MKRLIVLFVVILVVTGCENPTGEGGANKTGSVAATGISGVPKWGFTGVIDLSGVTVMPENATYNQIVWSVTNAGTTGADIVSGQLTAVAAGTLTVRGTVTGSMEDYTQDFTIQIVGPQPGTWTKAADVPAQMPNEIQTVCYGNGVFVAGSRENDGRIAWSNDGGVTWHGLNSAATTFRDTIDGKVVENFVHVRFLNGKFWAVGGNHHMAYSEDGNTWTAVADPGITQNIVDIAYGSGVFVAGGDRGTMSYSTDGGATWTANNQTVFFKAGGSIANFKAIIFAEGKFLAVGQFAKAIYSSDGINWTNVSETIKTDIIQHYNSDWPSSSSHLGLSVAAYGAGVYIIGGQGVLGVSTDLKHWERIDMEPFGFARGHSFGWINSLIYADGLFVLGGGDGKAAYSVDGRTWVPVDTNPIFHNFHFINGLAYDGAGGFVAVGATCTNPDSHSPTDIRSYVHSGDVGCVAYIKP
jgi:hypothetical protein